jgi:Zn-dependent alcohol dehydrogenase
VSGAVLTKYEKTIKGSMFGTLNPHYDIVKLLRLYDAGILKLDELRTKTYRLEDVNEGYRDMIEGRIIRGVILHDQ